MNEKYVDLTPVNTADREGHYAEAIKIALENKNVKNIALTGPYGSGKSSIINSFEKKYRAPRLSIRREIKSLLLSGCTSKRDGVKSSYNFMNISLASFSEHKADVGSAEKSNKTKSAEGAEPLSGDDSSDILIERSILQQMIYGISSQEIPLSRFKTITKDIFEDSKSYFFITWLLMTIVSVNILSSGFFSKLISITSFVSWSVITFSISGLMLYTIDAYRHINRKSFKKINVKNGEIELGEQTENSILNRYLDEILYFFQCNTFDVVIFEDLDRFGSSEIFVKLREINTLINKSKEINRRVVFLYAIKDEIFAHKERAKFFDFIIPVIPTINSSNSYEKLKDRLPKKQYSNLSTGRRLDQNFLKEVSIYIDDMRLLNNIVNEMNLYFSVLFSGHLNPTKLLSLIIYKNVYPGDFSKLHENKGLVYTCCNSRLKLIENCTVDLVDNIEQIDTELQLISNQIKHQQKMSIEDLKGIYLYKILEKTQGNCHSIHVNGNYIEFAKLQEEEIFNELLALDKINYRYITHGWNKQSLNLSFRDIEHEINPKFGYLERRDLLLGLKTDNQKKLEDKKNKLLSEKLAITKLALCELLQKDNKLPLFSEEKYVNNNSYNLLRYLLRNGHIDEYYHDHMSYFYDGRLSHNDMSFIKAIRDFRPSDFGLQLTYYDEIIQNRLRESDFKEGYIFNVSLLDYLVEHASTYNQELIFVLENISRNIGNLWEFSLEFIEVSRFVERFIQLLSKQWPGYAHTIVESNELNGEQKNNLIKLILLHVESEYICDEMDKEGIFSDYLAINPESTLYLSSAEQITVYSKLDDLNIKFKDLEDLNADEKLISYVFDHSLYEITSENICLLLSKQDKKQDEIEHKNLSVIYHCDLEHFIHYVEENFEAYLTNVFLALPDNTDESSDTIVRLLNYSISIDLKEAIIQKQNHVFESFYEIQTDLWAHLLIESKIKMTWGNLVEFYNEFPDDKGGLIDVLNKHAQCLSIIKINTEPALKEVTESIIQIILRDDSIENAAFSLLIKALPFKYTNLVYYDLNLDKMTSLLRENVLTLSEKNYEGLTEYHPELVGKLILNNLTYYWAKSDKYELSSDTSLYLLDTITPLANQVALIKLLDENNLKDKADLANKIAHILSKVIGLKQFEESLLYIVIENSTDPLKVIPLFIKLIDMFDKDEKTKLLESMGQPYSQIASFKYNPKLENNSLHRELALALKESGYISSQKVKNNKVEIYTKKY